MSPPFAYPDAVLSTLPGALPGMMIGIFAVMIPLVLLTLVLAVLGGFLSSPTAKGRFGEAIVWVGALKRLDPTIYRVFNDIVLPRPDGNGTTQIDHVVVSPFGIFVIETKNYAGWIFGNEHSRTWTQVIYQKKSRFQNPIHQNFLHVSALVKATGLPREWFHNLVYFVGDATLKTPLPPQVMTKGLVSFIRGHRVEVVPTQEVARAVEVLEATRPTAVEQRREHLLRVRGGEGGKISCS